MCGRYTLVKEIKLLTKKFNLTASPEIEAFKSFNIAPSQQAPVLASDNPSTLQMFTFGYIPEWQKTRKYLINARSEGSAKYYNQEDDPNYTGAFHIKDSREFRSLIRGQRCLIWANCFFEGSKEEKLSKPFVVYLKEKRIFALAGIWKEWVDKSTGELKKSFAILTTYPNGMMKKHVKHHRTPVIIQEHDYQKWLNLETPLPDVTDLLHPLPEHDMNAYPVNTRVKNVRNNDRDIIEPIGERVYAETEFKIEERLHKTGFGDSNARRRRADEKKRK
ncbi:MAG: SOS response-associated peptidase [Saprospiraceae bacterium]|nr:SOS response-associated peptidase [Saprospiraceae bacterium]